MKKVLTIILACMLIIQACKKTNSNENREQLKKELAKNILGKWNLKKIIITINDGIPQPTDPIQDTNCYIFNTDTLGIDKTQGVNNSFVYKVLNTDFIQINEDKCTVQINGLKMHLERTSFFAGQPTKTTMDFEKDEIGSLYEILTGKWTITDYTKTVNGVVTKPHLSFDPSFIFKKGKDTTVSYTTSARGGQDAEQRNDTTYKVTAPYQFIFDTLQTNVTIIDPLQCKLNMISTKTPGIKKEFSLQRQ